MDLAFPKIDDAFFHDVANIFTADVPAVHAAKGVLGIVQVGRMPVEEFSPLGLAPPQKNKHGEEQKHH